MEQQKKLLHPHFSVERRLDGIIVYHLTAYNPEAIDLFMTTAMEEDRKAYAEKRPILSLTDLTKAGYPTLYFIRSATRTAFQTPADLQEAVVFMLDDKIIFWRSAQYFLDALPAWTRQKFRIFTKSQEDEAIEWLLSCLQPK